MTKWAVVIGAFMTIYGLVCFLGAVFKWDKYSLHPKLFPLGQSAPWKADMYGWLYDTYGDKAVRKGVLLSSLIFVFLGIALPVAMVRDDAERGRIDSYPVVRQGETFSIAGGELTLEEAGVADGFTAIRFNVDMERYEEVEVKADVSGEIMLLFQGTFTNNSESTLFIRREDIEFYAKLDEGHNIKGQSVVDGYYVKTGEAEVSAGESVSFFFWLSLSKDEWKQDFTMVLRYGETGYRIGL